MSELYGRQLIFILSYGALTVCLAGTIWVQNIESLLVLRFLAGALGSSPLTNAGGNIADLFPAVERGLAMVSHSRVPQQRVLTHSSLCLQRRPSLDRRLVQL